jgi:hypothetical protein
MVRRALSILRFGWLTLRIAGPRVFLRQLRHQLYGRTIFIRTGRELREWSMPVSGVNCYVRFATPDEVDEFFRKMDQESPESRYQLLVRRWFYESGFHRVIIAWTADTHEMCNIRWMVTARDMRDTGFESRLPPLREDEVNFENVYTLEPFRGRGIQNESVFQAGEMARMLGYKRTAGQVAEDNIASLKSNRKRGSHMSGRILERHLFFRVKRRTLESFDPPVPIPVPGEDAEPVGDDG